MIIVAFFLILILTVQMTNKKNEAEPTDEMLTFERKDSLIIFGCLLFSIFLNWFSHKFFENIYFIILGISSGVFLMILIIVNINREAKIKRKHDQIIKVFQALTDVLGGVDIESINFSQVPFELEEDDKTGDINKIIIDTSISGGKFNENTIISTQYNINKFFPDSQWTSIMDYPKRLLTFKGLPKPPSIAKYPGSDYRPTGWIPLGLSGAGEVGWNIADPKGPIMGHSSYINDEGKIPDAVDMPSAPQCLTLGSTGGGKSIFVDQIVDIQKIK